VQLETGDRAEAVASLSLALARSKALGYRVGEAAALHYLAVAQSETEDPRGASRSLTQALDIYRDLGDRLGEARTLNVIGETAPPAEAAGFHRQALEMATELGAPIEQARAQEGIGRCLLRQGQAELAAQYLTQALATYRRIGSPRAGKVDQALRDSGLP
jgi:tetratricopeptide (TPR) repeat protein